MHTQEERVNLGCEELLLLMLVVEMVLLLVLGCATGHGVGFSLRILVFSP